MKLAFRVLVLSVVVAGAAAASVSPAPKHISHQSATAGLPVPLCGPGICK